MEKGTRLARELRGVRSRNRTWPLERFIKKLCVGVVAGSDSGVVDVEVVEEEDLARMEEKIT